MSLKEIFTTRKWGITLEEFLVICICVTVADETCDFFDLNDWGWLQFLVWVGAWLLTALLYTIIKALIITIRDKNES